MTGGGPFSASFFKNPFKSDVGPIWGQYWAHQGPILGPSWPHLGPILAPSWAHLGPTLPNLGQVYHHCQLDYTERLNLSQICYSRLIPSGPVFVVPRPFPSAAFVLSISVQLPVQLQLVGGGAAASPPHPPPLSIGLLSRASGQEESCLQFLASLCYHCSRALQLDPANPTPQPNIIC